MSSHRAFGGGAVKAVLQRVQRASVEVTGERCAQIEQGLMILLGVVPADQVSEAEFLAQKCAQLRIFEDGQGKMNRSLLDVGGEALVVSQFTLCADCRHGRRPAFTGAARAEHARPLYERFVKRLAECGVPVQTGRFGADMQVSLQNDGPVTIILDTEEMMPGRL